MSALPATFTNHAYPWALVRRSVDYTQRYSVPPPSIGWWPASFGNLSCVYRWWNGEVWSAQATEFMSPNEAEVSAAMPLKKHTSELIRWKHRPADWPQRSRT